MRPDLKNLWTIIEYCDSIRNDIQRFGTDVEDFLSDKAYQRSVSFSVIQIGEVAKRLSPELIREFDDVEWEDIMGMRDIFAHQYHNVNMMVLWRTINSDVPELADVCRKIVATLEFRS